MKPLSNIKSQVFILLDTINLLTREIQRDPDSLDLTLYKDISSRLDSNKNNKLVGDNSIAKGNLLTYLDTLISSPTVTNSSEVILRLLAILPEDIDKDTVKEMFNDKDENLIKQLRYKLQKYVAKENTIGVLKSALFSTTSTEDPDLKNILSEAIPKLEEAYTTGSENEHVTLEITSDDIGDDKIEELSDKAEASLNKKVYPTGFQALNRMLQGGYRAGQFTTIGGLPSNFKTGLSIRAFQDIATLSKPTIWPDGKQSVLVWFSFEDPLGTTIKQMYQSLKTDETGECPDLNSVSNKEIFKYVLNKLKETGYHVIFRKIDANDWSFRELFSELEAIEKQGYRIEALTLDYLPHIPTTGCINNSGTTGAPLRELVRRVSHYCEARDILLMTPIQLNTRAKDLLRNGVEPSEFVKLLPGKGMYADSSQLDQEIFLELFTHIAVVDGKAYLTIQRGKHKLPSYIPEKDKHVIIPLPELGHARSDIGREPIDIKDIYADTSSSSNVFDF